jgi:hypothetical protein
MLYHSFYHREPQASKLSIYNIYTLKAIVNRNILNALVKFRPTFPAYPTFHGASVEDRIGRRIFFQLLFLSGGVPP